MSGTTGAVCFSPGLVEQSAERNQMQNLRVVVRRAQCMCELGAGDGVSPLSRWRRAGVIHSHHGSGSHVSWQRVHLSLLAVKLPQKLFWKKCIAYSNKQ